MTQFINKKVQKARTLYIIFALLVAACNTHLLRGTAPSSLIFSMDEVLSGQLYRLFTHPLVHVSWYHLVLDSICMGLLFSAARTSLAGKMWSILCCGTISLVYAVIASPYIAFTGYCGLSGIAHGFMFLVGWLWLFPAQKEENSETAISRTLGLLFCLISLSKSIWEVHSGQILFSGSHGGYLGTPIVHAHLGGVVGGLLSALLITGRRTFSGSPRDVHSKHCMHT